MAPVVGYKTSYKDNRSSILSSRRFPLAIDPYPKAILVTYISLYTLVSLLRRYNKYNFNPVA
jgi:hypothetical protein